MDQNIVYSYSKTSLQVQSVGQSSEAVATCLTPKLGRYILNETGLFDCEIHACFEIGTEAKIFVVEFIDNDNPEILAYKAAMTELLVECLRENNISVESGSNMVL